jgi:hypothetical protein
VVVEAEFNGTTKTTPRSERGSALKKGRIRSKKKEKRLDRVGIVIALGKAWKGRNRR